MTPAGVAQPAAPLAFSYVAPAWPREALEQRSVLNPAPLDYPDVMLDPDPPLPARRPRLQALAHRLKDPAGLAAAVGRLTRLSGEGD